MDPRKQLSADGLIGIIRHEYGKIPDHRKDPERADIRMLDAAMSGYATFSLKCPSLLNFQDRILSVEEGENIKSLYGIETVSSDTRMRELLDPVDPKYIASPFNKIFAAAQRGKVLEPYLWKVNNSYLAPMDGTGYFSSTKVKCDSCLVKEYLPEEAKKIKKEITDEFKKEMEDELKSKDKTKKNEAKIKLEIRIEEELNKRLEEMDIEKEKTYHHQLLGLALVYPGNNVVIPFCPEPIINSDGSTKNDCEINAGKRLLARTRREHPHLRMTITGDDLYSRGPFIKLLGKDQHDMDYILVAKESSHPYLFDYVASLEKIPVFEREGLSTVHNLEIVESKGEKVIKKITHTFRYVNKVPLNDENSDLLVNFLEYWETEEYTDKKGIFHESVKFHSSWVTCIEITNDNVYLIMRGARARWNIENCVFNTLKNQGYNLEHSYGHGEQNLSTNFALMMMLAFLVDQILAACCGLFKKALGKLKTKVRLWEEIRTLLRYFKFDSWEMLFNKIIYSIQTTAEMSIDKKNSS